ncbi:unnamed protein product [Dicrocoelium dendriticum]|nr:unnamed protein product [Dicrocoelium dendriticum]
MPSFTFASAMSCTAGTKCIRHTKLIDWDFRTRFIEHRIQQIYGKTRNCSISTARAEKYTRRKSLSLKRLSDFLHQQLTAEPNFKMRHLGSNMTAHQVYSMVQTLVPHTRILDYCMQTRKNHFHPTLTLSYLADLPPICLECVPKNTFVDLLDQLCATRLMHKPPSVSGWPQMSDLMGSVLKSTWEFTTVTHALREPKATTKPGLDKYNERPYIPPSVKNGRQQRKGNLVINVTQRAGQKVFTERKSRKLASTSKIKNKPRITGNSQPPLHRKQKQQRSSIILYRSAQTPKSVSSLALDTLPASDDDATTDAVESLMDRNAKHPSSAPIESVQASLGKNAILPVSFRYNGKNFFEHRNSFVRSATTKPVCEIIVPSTQRKKYIIRQLLSCALPAQQYHPQLLRMSQTISKATKASYLHKSLREYNSRRMKVNGSQTNTSRSAFSNVMQKATENVTDRVVGISQDANSVGDEDVQKSEWNLERIMDKPPKPHVHKSRSLQVARDPARLHKEVVGKNNFRWGTPPSNTCSRTEMAERKSKSTLKPSLTKRKVIEEKATLLGRRIDCTSPMTPPYTPVWTRNYADEARESSCNSADYSAYLSIYLPHPTPEEHCEADSSTSHQVNLSHDVGWREEGSLSTESSLHKPWGRCPVRCVRSCRSAPASPTMPRNLLWFEDA